MIGRLGGGTLSRANGAEMGQAVLQSMPFSAHYAFMQPTVSGPHSQQPRDYHSKSPTYPYTMGLWLKQQVLGELR